MKKLLILGLCTLLFTGCADIKQQLSEYGRFEDEILKVDLQKKGWTTFDKKYYKIDTGEWNALKERIDKAVRGYSYYETTGGDGRNNENYSSIAISDTNAEDMQEVLAVFKETLGPEVQELIDEVQGIEEKEYVEVTRDKVINGYGVICTKFDKTIQMRFIKNNKVIVDKDSQELISKIESPYYILTGMYVGKNNNMIQMTTPTFLRNGWQSASGWKAASYYQIYRKNSGAVDKVRFIIKQFKNETVEKQYVESLKTLAHVMGADGVNAESMILELQKVCQNEEVKSKGRINNISYEINRYKESTKGGEALIEVLLKVE